MRRYVTIVLIVFAACADPEIRTFVDPVSTPTIEMSAPAHIDGAVLLHWRYLAAGSDLAQFRITRATQTHTSVLGTIAAKALPDWQEVSFTDSIFIAGAEVTYGVQALDLNGGVIGSESDRIRVHGTVLEASPDNDKLVNVLMWKDVPPEAVGFEVWRTDTDGDRVSLLSTTNTVDRSFEDRPPMGNTEYQYAVNTRFGNGRQTSSDFVPCVLFAHSRTATAPSLPPTEKFVLYRDPNGSPRALAVGDHFILHNPPGPIVERLQLTLPQADARPLAVGGLFTNDTSLLNGVVGRNLSNTEVFISVYPSPAEGQTQFVLEPIATHRWPTTKTGGAGATWAGGSSGRFVFYDGDLVRVLDETFQIEAEIEIEYGEPIDIDYQARSLWLAYPDRLLKSNDDPLRNGFERWSEVPIPPSITITAFSRYFEDKLLVLDGITAKIHVMDLDGRVLLTTDGLGSALERGDIMFRIRSEGVPEVYLIDGQGHMYHFWWRESWVAVSAVST